MTLLHQGQSLSTAAAKAGMDEGTARKYRRSGTLPSEGRRWCIVVLPCPGKARSRLAPHTAGGTQSGDEVEGPSEVQNEVPR